MAKKEDHLDIPTYRHYGGKRYRRAYTFTTKKKADQEAASLQKGGFGARVEQYGKNYVVYAR